MEILKKSKIAYWTIIALVAGIIFGWLCPHYAVKLQPLVDIFLRMIKMIIAPLLFSTLVVGIAGHDNIKSLGKIGLKTFVYFEVVTTIALFLGLFVGNVFKPGSDVAVQVSDVFMQRAQGFIGQNNYGTMTDSIVNIIPESITDAMATGNLLQIVVFAIFFALAACAVGGRKAKPVLDVLSSVSDIMFKFTGYVMCFAPIGVFAAIAVAIGHSDISILGTYVKLIGCVLLALISFIIFILMVACKIIKVPFWGLIRALSSPALLAFSTASSEAALPSAMEILEEFGAQRCVVDFVMPAGYTFNLDGSTLYLSLATLFCTQLIGVNLTLPQQLVLVLTLMLTSKGIAGVPRVGLIVLAGTLSTFNYSLLGVAILLGIDPILDMCRTTVNLIGNCVATLVVSRWEDKFDYKKMNVFLKKEGIKV